MSSARSSNTFSTFLATVNSDAKDEPTAAPDTASEASSEPDPEASAKEVLRSLTSGALQKGALLSRLQAEPNPPVHSGAELDDVLHYLIQSEMVEVDQDELVSLTDFAGQALSVFKV